MDRAAPDDDDPLHEVVRRFTSALREDGPHRPPVVAEAALVPALVAALVDTGRPDPSGRLAVAGRALGLVATNVATNVATDVAAHTVLASDPTTERSWVLLIARAGVVPPVLVEVPHPRADLRTELVGLAVLRHLPGALLLQAGAHRRAGGYVVSPHHPGPADVAHGADTLFALLADGVVARTGAPQVQLHGFADRPGGVDVVVSAGATREAALVLGVAERIAAAGERVALGSDPACADLAGTRNVQGRSAARHGTEFVHLELSRSLRRDAARRAAVAAAAAGALGATP